MSSEKIIARLGDQVSILEVCEGGSIFKYYVRVDGIAQRVAPKDLVDFANDLLNDVRPAAPGQWASPPAEKAAAASANPYLDLARGAGSTAAERREEARKTRNPYHEESVTGRFEVEHPPLRQTPRAAGRSPLEFAQLYGGGRRIPEPQLDKDTLSQSALYSQHDQLLDDWTKQVMDRLLNYPPQVPDEILFIDEDPAPSKRELARKINEIIDYLTKTKASSA